MTKIAEKADLSTEERITVAYLYHVRGVEQQDLAAAYNVNSGRISEACTAIAMAAQNPKTMRRAMERTDVKQTDSPRLLVAGA